jgi:glycine dehydrogenase subunit 1
MPYHYNTPDDQREMLAAIGAESLDDLFAPIPDNLRLNRALDLPPALTEVELDAHLSQLASRNCHAGDHVCFLGGGIYDHFVPAVVDAIGSRSEFYTSYTPYQAEASQGNLQAIFEYQSLITRLTGMAVSNSSLYDGASSTAEAVLMALGAAGKRRRILVPQSLHPEYREVIATYLVNLDAELVTVPMSEGLVDLDALALQANDDTAAILIQQPNFFGCIEDVHRVAEIARSSGATLISVFDPLSLGVLQRPGDYGANIAVAEGQTLGTPMSYGGPVLGILACDQSLIRRMPGRVVGETVDRRGTKCFVLTLQTREQHIRRDKATSNVCTNQSLFAVRASVYLAQLGPQGLRETAELCLHKARYLAQRLCQSDRFSLAFTAPTFKEFVLRDAENKVPELLSTALEAGYLAGLDLGRWYPELSDCLLIAVTEKRTRLQLDTLAELLTGSDRPAAVSRASDAYA